MKESERDKRESKRAKGSWQLRKTAVGLFCYFGVFHNTAARGVLVIEQAVKADGIPEVSADKGESFKGYT